jgi:hypothetical protein
LGLSVVLVSLLPAVPAQAAAAPAPTAVVSLDGPQWLLAPDPKNVGREQQWFKQARPDVKRTEVPWIIQDAFPGQHGLFWYWRDFSCPVNDRPAGRYLLRFWEVDYKCDVWLNGLPVGTHEGGESCFVLDVTAAIRPGQVNRLAVRVLNPTHQPIDGIVLSETPHRNKALPYSSGSAWDQGGIIDSVELLLAPAVRVADLFVRPDWKTGVMRIQVTLANATPAAAEAQIELTAAPAASGETVAVGRVSQVLPPGESTIEAELRVANPRLWELDDPFLYRVTARAIAQAPASLDEHSVRCGFREFRFDKGAFRLNGRRIYVRSSHTGNCCPIGLEMPHDPDYLRRDLVNAKMMRFNAIRFIAGVAKRYQLDLCDEIGLMVYEEAYASWCLADSPKMAERYDESLLGMVRRDRNHPSVTIWGLLNETSDGPVFRHAVAFLPKLRKLDDTRMVMLNAGRFDNAGGVAGIEAWRNAGRSDPCVIRNPTKNTIKALGITWVPGRMSFHPGRDGEYAVVRWTAPADGRVQIDAAFMSIAERATTDVHVLHNSRTLFDGFINVRDGGPDCRFQHALDVKKADTLDFACGWGNGNYGADTTGLEIKIAAPGRTDDAAAQFTPAKNPNGPWSYGQLAPGPAPKSETFTIFPVGMTETSIGSLSNPGSMVWEDVLSDQHPYQRVPHTAEIIRTLRTLHGNGLPVFNSEYGIGSAMDLMRITRHFEQAGKTDVEDAQLYRSWRDQFLADYKRYRMDDTFPRPEDFFEASIARMAAQRLLGLNAIRSNPNVVGHSLTGTLDQGMTAEGLWTTFRELKPGTTDAVFDGFAPLRWCLFVEPVNVYPGTPVRLEAVLANEDVLAPGKYPARLLVVGPDARKVFERSISVTIPERRPQAEPPMVLPVFAEDVKLREGPTGKYRFLATFERGAAAAGGETEFYVTDPSDVPATGSQGVAILDEDWKKVVLWGDDPGLAKWLADRRIFARPFSSPGPKWREVILVSSAPQRPGDAAAFAELARRIARGSTAIFLSPAVFARKDQPAGWVPLVRKGTVAGLPSWLYHKDEWCKRHPIFNGLPSGGLMDYTFYREIIPDGAFVGQDPPAEAVAVGINASQDYSSGVFTGVWGLGAGRFVLNTLRIRENLGPNPVAEKLLRNLLRWAASHAEKPLADLPPDFDQQLRAMGYQ